MIEIYPLRAISRCRMADHICSEDTGDGLRIMDISKIIKHIKEVATAIGNNL
jgi:hypothetical protein